LNVKHVLEIFQQPAFLVIVIKYILITSVLIFALSYFTIILEIVKVVSNLALTVLVLKIISVVLAFLPRYISRINAFQNVQNTISILQAFV
jgi:hypothetical protein